MRITNNYIYTTAENNVSDGYSKVANLQNEISTGVRVSEASIDPVGMGEITRLQSQIESIEQGEKNASVAQTQLETERTQLNSLGSIIQSIITTSQKLANGTTSPDDIKNQSAQLSQYLEQIISIANSKNPDGDGIFGGTNIKQDAYSVTKDSDGNITAVTYQGNDDQKAIYLNGATAVHVYQSGNTVFGSGSDSIFSNLISYINQVKTGSLTADQASEEIKKITAFQNSTIVNQFKTDNQYNTATFEVNLFHSLKQNYTQMIGKIRDADYTTVVTQLSQQTTVLKATLAASQQLEKLNLFDQE